MDTFRKNGHTLVEIMIIVAIIGLLLIIAVPNFIRAHSTAAANACIENIRQLDAAVHTHMTNTGSWPTQFNDLIPYIINAVPSRCPDDGAVYSLQTGSGVTYSNCPNHGNVAGL